MKYIITEEQFDQLINQDHSDNEEKTIKKMEKVFKLLFGNIELPLGSYEVNDRYLYYNLSDGKVLFVENGDINDLTQTKWIVDNSLETIEQMFGKTNFEKFILHYFNFNIADKGKKRRDRAFVNLNKK